MQIVHETSSKILYSTLLILIILNCLWYRQFFIELWMAASLLNENIVVSLSTTPHRINHIQETLETVLSQNAPIRQIYISIPYVFKRDNLEYKIPQWLQDEKRITILRSQDYGPATKLLGVLEQVKLTPNTIIVIVDDDVKYPKNLALHLAYQAKLNPNKAIGVLGADPIYGQDHELIDDADIGMQRVRKNNSQASVLQGYAGVAYRRSFFDSSIFNIVSASQDCKNSDDLYISFYLAKHNIPRQIVKNEYISLCYINWSLDIGLNQDALHMLSPRPALKHRSCIAFMKRNDPHVIF